RRCPPSALPVAAGRRSPLPSALPARRAPRVPVHPAPFPLPASAATSVRESLRSWPLLRLRAAAVGIMPVALPLDEGPFYMKGCHEIRDAGPDFLRHRNRLDDAADCFRHGLALIRIGGHGGQLAAVLGHFQGNPERGARGREIVAVMRGGAALQNHLRRPGIEESV